MVRQLTTPRRRGWKATLAAFAAAGMVAAHIMACVESPMSFSPTGDLAFTVMDPYTGFDEPLHLVEDRAYRLMVLSKDRELREVERSYTHMLTAPAFSPDGSQFAYLRLPLLTPEDERRISAFFNERKGAEDNGEDADEAPDWILIAPEGWGPGDAEAGNLGFDSREFPPSLGSTFRNFIRAEELGGLISAELVLRLSSTGDVVGTVPFTIPHLGDDMASVPMPYFMAYLATRPQFGPDGVRVYLSLDGVGMAVNLSTGEKRLHHFGDAAGIAANNHRGFLLSPDGKTLAAADIGTLGFLSTDGKRANYVSLDRRPALGGMAWLDSRSLLVLSEEEAVLDLYDANGNLIRSQVLTGKPDESDEDITAQLAVSPDGEYMVVTYDDAVQFLARDGRVLGSWEAGDTNGVLAQPTFTPDSRQVAFKLLVAEEDEDKLAGTSAIVFFTPEGQELFRVPIPPIPADERPAPPAPATEETPQ
jgi:hypothetical protein